MRARLHSIKPVWHLAEHAYLAWQLRHINPLAPDVARIVMRKNEIEVPL